MRRELTAARAVDADEIVERVDEERPNLVEDVDGIESHIVFVLNNR